jgi:hypothetical protein
MFRNGQDRRTVETHDWNEQSINGTKRLPVHQPCKHYKKNVMNDTLQVLT